MRRQFQHHIGPVIALDRLHRFRKTDTLANVRPPVGTVQSRGFSNTCHRRDEGDMSMSKEHVVEEGECLRRIIS